MQALNKSFNEQKAVLDIEVHSVTPKKKDADLEKGERGGSFFIAHLKKIARKLDLYSIQEVPHSLAASAVSLLILIGVLVYTIIIVYQYVHQGRTRTAEVHWTPGAGPFPAELKCLAENGCFISNRVYAAWTYGVTVIPYQMSCFRLQFGESAIINVTYSTNPEDGLDVIYNGSATPADFPPLFGLYLTSRAACRVGEPTCNEGAMPMSPPIGPGINFLDLVETTNHTQSGFGHFRREWFVSRVDKDVSVTEGVCLEAHPELANPVYVQSSLRLAASYTEQDIFYQSLFLVVMGSVGGAYSLFLQIGALLLVVSLIYDMYAKNKAARQIGALLLVVSLIYDMHAKNKASRQIGALLLVVSLIYDMYAKNKASRQKTLEVLQDLKIARMASGIKVYPLNLDSVGDKLATRHGMKFTVGNPQSWLTLNLGRQPLPLHSLASLLTSAKVSVHPLNLDSPSSSELGTSPATPAFLGQPPDLSQGFLDRLSGASATPIMGQAFSMIIDLQALLAAGGMASAGSSSAPELEFPRVEEEETAIKLLGSLCTPAYDPELIITDTVHMLIFLGMIKRHGNNRISWVSKFPAHVSTPPMGAADKFPVHISTLRGVNALDKFPAKVSTPPMGALDKCPPHVSTPPMGSLDMLPAHVSTPPTSALAKFPVHVSTPPVGALEMLPAHVSTPPTSALAKFPVHVSTSPMKSMSALDKFPANESTPPMGTLNNTLTTPPIRAIVTVANRFGGILQAMYAIENLALQVQQPVREAQATLAW
eukprot:gene31053-7147_t